jgi:hypothetical protein
MNRVPINPSDLTLLRYKKLPSRSKRPWVHSNLQVEYLRNKRTRLIKINNHSNNSLKALPCKLRIQLQAIQSKEIYRLQNYKILKNLRQLLRQLLNQNQFINLRTQKLNLLVVLKSQIKQWYSKRFKCMPLRSIWVSLPIRSMKWKLNSKKILPQSNPLCNTLASSNLKNLRNRLSK